MKTQTGCIERQTQKIEEAACLTGLIRERAAARRERRVREAKLAFELFPDTRRFSRARLELALDDGSPLVLEARPQGNAIAMPGLGYGGWNDCPNPHEHVALHRSWYERYGAEMATYSGDVVELYVRRPLTDPDEAMRVAREQYVYCTDIVDQGCGTMQVLADSILGATFWYFWWD